jgi:hypothetical protein
MFFLLAAIFTMKKWWKVLEVPFGISPYRYQYRKFEK